MPSSQKPRASQAFGAPNLLVSMPTTQQTETKQFPTTPEPGGSVWAAIWLYLRYHLLTKTLLAFGVLPVFTWATNQLIRSTGREVIGREEIIQLALSGQGITLAALFVGFLMLAIATDISAFIIMEATRLLRGQLPGVFPTLGYALKAITQFAKPSTLLLIAYMALIVPLSGVGLSIGPLRQFALPVQAQEAIQSNAVYLNTYYGILAAFLVTSLLLIFTFHFIILHDASPWQGMKQSARFVVENARSLGLLMAKRLAFIALIVGGFTLVGALVLSVINGVAFEDQVRGITIIVGVLLAIQANGVVLFILLPMQIANLTRLFVTYHTPPETDESETAPLAFHLTYLPQPPEQPSPYPHLFVAGVLLIDVVLNGVGAYRTLVQVDDLTQARQPSTVIANHRTNGQEPAPTLASIRHSLDQGFNEIYVDAIWDDQDQVPPHTSLSQLMSELKAPTLVIAAVPRGSTQAQVDALIAAQPSTGAQLTLASEDYALLQHVHRAHPHVRTAFIAGLSVGDFSQVTTDMVILESFEAHQGRATDLKHHGIRTILNTSDPAERVATQLHPDIDAIITNQPEALRAALTNREGQSDLDLLWQATFGQ